MANQVENNTELVETGEAIIVDGLKVSCDTSRRTHQGSMEIRGETTTLYQTNRGAISAEGTFDQVAHFVKNAGLVDALRIDALSSTNALTGEKTYFIDAIAGSVGAGSIGDFPLRFSLSLSQIVPRDNDSSDELAGADMSASADDWEAPTTEPDED